MNKDQVKGKGKQIEGRIEEGVGKIVGDDDMEKGGKFKNTVGKVQSRLGSFKAKMKKQK